MNLNYNLTKNITDILYFLETSEDSIIDEDSAVSVMEQISTRLQENNSSDLDLLIKLIEQIGGEESNQEKAAFIKSLPKNIGLK